MRLPQTFEQHVRRLTAAFRQHRLGVKAISFALIGVVNTVVDFSLFSLGYFWLELPLVTANVLSWSVAVSNSYVLNSMITFAAESGRRLRLRDYLTFVAAQTGGLVANTATVVVASYVIPVLLAKVLAIGASFLVDFSLSQFVVFRRPEKTPQP